MSDSRHFKVGDRVRMSAFGIERLSPYAKRDDQTTHTGTVTHVIKRTIRNAGRPPTIWVLRDGRRAPLQYACAYWEPLPPDVDPREAIKIAHDAARNSTTLNRLADLFMHDYGDPASAFDDD